MPTTNVPLLEGMEVLGSDGRSLGHVKEIGNMFFLLDRPMRLDMRLPLDIVESVDGERVKLAVTSDQAENREWPSHSGSGPDVGGKVTPSDLPA